MLSAAAAIETDRKFKEEIEATLLTIFEPLVDLGYYGWKAKGAYKSLAYVNEADSIELDVMPDSIVHR